MLRDRVHVRIRLRQRDAGFHAGENHQPVEIVIDLLGLENQRNEEFGVAAISLPAGRTPMIV